MRKLFIGLISALLILTFILMAIPKSLSYLISLSSHDLKPLDFASPSFNDKTSFYYELFVNECVVPFKELEGEMLTLIDRKDQGEEVTYDLNMLEILINDLKEMPKYHSSLLEPLYEEFRMMKSELILAMTYVQSNEAINEEFREHLMTYLSDSTGREERLFQKTIEILKENHIVFYIEDDMTITIYD